MTSKISKAGECVKVVIRCRPMDRKEIEAGHTKCVSMDTKRGTVVLQKPKGASGDDASRTFTFDAVYDTDSKQQELYDETFRDLVQSVLDGFNGTIFAYGQTGTGKTFTMQGVKDNPELRGVIPNSFEHIFTQIARSQNAQYLVRASYLEIYKEEIRDLLHKDQDKRLEIKEKPDTGVYVKDLSSVLTRNIREIEKVMNIGNQNRSVGATNMNEHSSRSHAIFIITIECSESVVGVGNEAGADGENHIRVGKLNMVDLAGSERQSKTQAEGERLKEATKINLSLSALGNVISALVDGKSTHIPYRDSKLTRLLQDSLGGNARTVMVTNIGPASYNYDETVNALRYANRAKNIKNKPKINEDPKDALLREYQSELDRLKDLLQSKGGMGKRPKSKKKREHRKKTRMLADGTVEEYSESDSGSDEESPEGVQHYVQEQQARLQAEKDAILNDRTLISGEKERLLKEIEDRESRLNEQKAEKDQLAAKIKAMESKLLVGGKNIQDHTNEQQRTLEQKRLEIAEQKNRAREIQQQMETKHEDVTKMKRGFATLKEEVDAYTKLLKAKFLECQNIKKEIEDCTEEHVRARQELEHHQEALTRELKKQILILENFVPQEDLEKFQKRAVYDEDAKTWRFIPLAKVNEEGQSMAMEKRPRSALGHRRPVSEFARAAANMGMNPRFRHENLLSLELDLPSRTTRDYEPPAMAPQVVAALEAALQDEDDLELDGGAISKSKNTKRDGKKTRRPRTGKSRAQDEDEYPASRGIMSRK